jgi:predicted transglutaminase-like cysteine proteinase
MKGIGQAVMTAALCAASIMAAFAGLGELGFSRSVSPTLIGHLARLFGDRAPERIEGWKKFARNTAEWPSREYEQSGEAELLRPVNGYFNRLRSITDLAHWGIDDYWATPAEFLASGGGDCEDYAIAKYFTLKELGVPISRLRLVYVRTSRANAAHMVLAYYATPDAEPLIMDNLEGRIQPVSDRPDLAPVYMFNDDDVQVLRGGIPGGRRDVRAVRQWGALLEKLVRELTY